MASVSGRLGETLHEGNADPSRVLWTEYWPSHGETGQCSQPATKSLAGLPPTDLALGSSHS